MAEGAPFRRATAESGFGSAPAYLLDGQPTWVRILLWINLLATLGMVAVSAIFGELICGFACLRLTTAVPASQIRLYFPRNFGLILLIDSIALACLPFFLFVGLEGELGSDLENSAIAVWAMCIFLLVVLIATGFLISGLRTLNRTAARVRAVSLRGVLAERGYGWMTHENHIDLIVLAGSKASRLPPWDHVGTLPRIEEGDIPALANLAKTLP
jgi:hypothetical protein